MGLQETIADVRTPTNKVTFVLMYGYFRATKRFFLRKHVPKDIEYVATRLGFKPEDIKIGTSVDNTYRRHKKLILKHFGYREFGKNAKKIVVKEIRAMVRSQSRPKLILRELVEILARRKIEVPSYFTLSALITEQMNYHKEELIKLIDSKLTTRTRKLLDALMERDENQQPSKLQRYKLTLMKKFSYAIKPAKIKSNVKDLVILRELYQELEPLIETLDLTREGLKYFAQYVLKARTWQISIKAEEDRYLHTVAFVVHQYYKLQDLLIDMVLSSVGQCINGAKRELKNQVFDQRAEKVRSWKGFATSVDDSVLGSLTDIEAIINKRGLVASRKIEQIKELLSQRKSVISDVQERLGELKEESENSLESADFYSILENRSVKLQNRVSEIIKWVEFDTESSNRNIMRAISYYREKDGSIDKNAPLAFLEPAARKHLKDDNEKLRVSLYKVLLFIGIADAIKAGTLNLVGSYRYRSLDEYLIPADVWNHEKEDILERSGLKTAAS